MLARLERGETISIDNTHPTAPTTIGLALFKTTVVLGRLAHCDSKEIQRGIENNSGKRSTSNSVPQM
jgi:hypothetical protein